MSSAFYIFRLVWPFLKEFVLGGVTLQEGMKTQKRRVYLLFFVSALIMLVFLIIPKFYQLYQEHSKLQESIDAVNVRRLEKEIEDLKKENQSLVGGKKDPPPTESPSTPHPDHVPPPQAELKEPTRPQRDPVQRPRPQPAPPPAGPVSETKRVYMDFFDNNDGY